MKELKKYKINCYCGVCEDSYEDGEGNFINHYATNGVIETTSPMEAIEWFVKERLYFDFNKANLAYPFNDWEHESKHRVDYSTLVDSENSEATETEIEEWKLGKKKLFAHYSNIYIEECIQVDLSEFFK